MLLTGRAVCGRRDPRPWQAGGLARVTHHRPRQASHGARIRRGVHYDVDRGDAWCGVHAGYVCGGGRIPRDIPLCPVSPKITRCIGTIAAAAFGAVLYTVVTGDSVVGALTGLVQRALSTEV